MMIENKKPTYIMSLEASDIFYHQHRDIIIKKEYYGMIPFSLELIKLHETGFKTKYISQRDKYLSDDIINVQFKTKVKSIPDMLEDINSNINSLKKDKNKEKNKKKKEYAMSVYLENKSTLNSILKDGVNIESSDTNSVSDIPSNLGEISTDKLREYLYQNGFKLKIKNARTGNEKTVDYVAYKRSSAKSRTGQCLFIKKDLYKQMINWSRMYLPFKENEEVDLAGLLAYESLVGSSIEDTVKINVSNILIVDDVDSKFKKIANVVRKNSKTGFLDSFKEEATISNSLFDGESLLDSSFFKENKSMMLLRNHMFKSASFNTNLEQFFKDEALNRQLDYNTWKIKDMYENELYVKDIKMIITPNSLKALKFKDVLDSKSEKEMWDYWRNLVHDEGSIFGICKYEKKSKLGTDISNNVLQQTSYQMINCLPIREAEIKELTETEKRYIDTLKNDDEYLIKEILRNADDINSNEALVDLYKINNNISRTQLFKNFKKRYVHNKVEHAKKGKIKVHGDYCVLLGNPMEFLYHTIKDKEESVLDNKYRKYLKDNEVHCTLFNDGEPLVGFRNPNTSPSNVLYMENRILPEVERYFNLSDNIIVVNAINFELQDILSGCDYDSDSMLVSNNESLVEIAKICMRDYLVCINNIEGDKKNYKLNTYDHYKIDQQLSNSQRIIGRVVNLGQLCMSAYWDAINSGNRGIEVEELLKKVDVMTILSGIAIDMAKKFYDIEMLKEIINVQNNKILKDKGKKPNFWVHVSQNKKIKEQIEPFKCPMDELMDYLSDNIDDAPDVKTISFDSLIKDDLTTKRADKRQMDRVLELIGNHRDEIIKIKTSTENEDKKRIQLLDLEEETKQTLKKWKLKAETMSVILKEGTFKERYSLDLIKMLHSCHKDEFFKVFKTK